MSEVQVQKNQRVNGPLHGEIQGGPAIKEPWRPLEEVSQNDQRSLEALRVQKALVEGAREANGMMAAGVNWPMLNMQQLQQRWLMQQLELYRLAQGLAVYRNTVMAAQAQVQAAQSLKRTQTSFVPFDKANSQARAMVTENPVFLGHEPQKEVENEGLPFGPNREAENHVQHRRSTTLLDFEDNQSLASFLNLQRSSNLGRPKKAPKNDSRIALLDSMLTKRDSSSLLSPMSTAESPSSRFPPESMPHFPAPQASRAAEAETEESSAPDLMTQLTVSLISKLDKGFEIIKPTISTSDMAFIRNYSRIIGYPLKTTQRNTKLGYFTSVCHQEGCPVNIIIRKFKLLTSPKIQHNH